MDTISTEARQPPATPKGVAISGIVFSVLYIASQVVTRLAAPADPLDPGVWLTDPVMRNWVRFALNLVPFTGIAFVWFMATLRSRIGLLEDRFFATVFFGSGLLFLAMLFASAAVAGGIIIAYSARTDKLVTREGTGFLTCTAIWMLEF